MLTAWFPLPSSLAAEVLVMALAAIWLLCVLRAFRARSRLREDAHQRSDLGRASMPAGARFSAFRWVRHYLSVRRDTASRVASTVKGGDGQYRLLLWLLAVEVTTLLLFASTVLLLDRYW